MDVWVACFGWESNGLYWGFAQGSRAETVEALASNATVVLFGGYGVTSALPLLRQFPEIQLDKVRSQAFNHKDLFDRMFYRANCLSTVK